ncbi:uncharacterized protein LOC122318126 isoform X7 [Carya illinoinensis]|uniref:uncharacterized protein LOC122318126 isoform X7 n=1 Tax=Carya illinoinensis TaxID=32201 RepID=UPI001C723E1A|nr:uncharacterized protein LOC122318126 isoform X7 [Carya illinoinensis]
MELVISIVAKIAEYTVAPVGQWLCYSCHYNSNMENLRNQEKNLRDFKKRVLHSIEAASRKGEEIEDDVQTWLAKVDGILHQLATEILGGGEAEAGTRSSNAACLNLKHRHQLSREAKKIVENIAELLKNGNFSKVGFRPAAQEMVNPINSDYMSLDSRISIMERIMEALGDANINRIGVWGSPGVGKSTLMKEIFQKAKEESLFHEVALANVTDTPDVIRIQGEIAEMLDLELDPDKIVTVRAGRLRARLEKDNEKKILVILDDVWKQLDLEEIGITPSERCKVLLTSRDRQVLADEMRTEKNSFKLDILGEQEAWKLFEKMAGDSIKDDHDLQNEAIKVAKACEGLPIALVTVSRALKNKNLSTWKDALVQLTRPPPKHDTKIWSPVYSCIELSYRHLDGREVKSLFLLCARQGYYISYRDLLRYGFGLRLFDRIYTLEEARNRLETLVNNLRDSCLLLQSPHSSEEFYMHDVVRHVATIIASNDHNMFVMRGDGGQKAWPDVDALKICEALSIHGGDHIHKYPNKIECPNLRYFHVRCKNRYLATPSSTSFQGMNKLEDIFFQGMDKLEVLSLTNIQLSSLLSLRNLQTLCLDECKLGDIHGIGELKNLVILSLARSDISNLPTEIGLLTRLQLLDLSSCYELKVIPPNVLSSLVNLEELYMRKITVQWEVEGPSNEGKNASLAELKKLSNLITLEIDIPDANNLPKDSFTEKLKRYKICIGGTWHLFFKEELAFSRMLKLKLNMSFQLDFGIKMLLKRTEYLHLDESNITKSVLYQLDREDFQQLKHLCIENNGNIKHIPELRTSVVAFPILETFVLKNMISLVEICQGNLPLESFKNLKVLKVDNCEKLIFIFSSSIARGLSLLEELNITGCNNMVAVFVKEEEDGIEDQGDMMLFGRLQTLVLQDLPKLVGFLSSKDSFMADCRETNSEGSHDLQLPLLHHDQVSLPSLQTLRMEGLPKIKHVWSCGQEPKTVFTGLEQLKILEITNCGVEEIVAVEGGGEVVAIRTFEFPRVSTLELRNLKRLKWFYKAVHVSKWPMLKKLKIERCEEVEIFASGVVSFEETIKERQSEMSIKQPLFLVDEVSFPSLQTLRMKGLPKIKYVWSCGQESKTVIRCLEQLQVLEIEDCGVEEIVAVERGGEAVAIRTLVFPQVTKLKFRNLPRLKWFYKGVHVSKWPMLKEMKIKRCEKVEIFASEVVSFEKAIKDQRQFEMSIKQPIFSVNEHSIPSLEILFISNMDSVEIIFGKLEGQNGKESQVLISPASGTEESGATTHFVSTGKLPLIYFKNLKVLEVENYQKLRFLFSSSIARGLSLLEKLKIKRCNNMGAIVVTEEKYGIEDGDVILFHQLQTLVLEDLPELVSFLSTKSSFMTDCGQIIAEGNHNLHMPLLHQVSFPSLQTLRMEGLPKIKYVWSCGQEPKTVIRCLEQLQVLEIEDCGVEEIVAVERGGGEVVAIRTLVFPQVTKLKFRNLPRLKWFYKRVHVSKWPMLKEMKIYSCEKVEVFASEVGSFEKIVEDQRQSEMSIKQSLFSVDEHSFPSLETLEFSNMDSLEIIFGKLEGQNGKEPQVSIFPASGTEESGATTHFVSTLSFPSLKKLHIRWMRKLEIIWQDQVTATSFPNIQELDIHNCDKLLHVFQSKLHTTTTLIQSLTVLNISYCSSLETVFGNMEGQNGKEPQVLIAPSSGTEDGIAGHIEFPILTELLLFELPKLKWIFEGVHTNLESWPSLKRLCLWECSEQVNKMMWASKFASSSSSQENQLPTCIQQPMFVVEEGTFPNLEYLSFCFRERTKCPSRFSDFPDPSSLLTGLPNLLNLNVYDRVWEEIFPYELVDREIRLRMLRLCRLCMLTHLWKEDNTQPCPLFHNLEYLHVLRCGKLRNIVPSSVSLRNLTRLEISDCHGLINLLTSSTAKTLVQLERMTVIDCKRITEIVAMEDGEANVAITFNKLRRLELRGLPNLTHFCSGHYSFGFPSLDEVIVRCCPEMKTFSHGVLSTPKLKGVSDDYSWFSKRNLYWEDDLNTTTRCLWEESNQYDTRLLFRERVENSEEDEDHPSEDEDHSENFEEDEDHPSEDEDHSENSEEDEDHPSEDEDHFETTEEW